MFRSVRVVWLHAELTAFPFLSLQVLGTVVMDLAELASFDGSTHQSLQVATNRAITAAVGSPILTVTVSCRWRGNTKGGKAYSEGGRSFDSSISTDTTTSTNQVRFGSLTQRAQRNVCGDRAVCREVPSWRPWPTPPQPAVFRRSVCVWSHCVSRQCGCGLAGICQFLSPTSICFLSKVPRRDISAEVVRIAQLLNLTDTCYSTRTQRRAD
jgi:hypothetical protein